MKRKERTLEEVEAFADQLEGPLGTALRGAGEIIEQRMRERGQQWPDLSDRDVVDLFVTAMMQAAPEAYSSTSRDVVENAVADMADSTYMELAANADGGAAKN